MKAIECGTVEVLRDRVYALDSETKQPETTALVSPGVYPLYRYVDMYFWVMDGELNGGGGMTTLGDGLSAAIPYDFGSGVAVRFPSQWFGPRKWRELRKLPLCQEGHPEQRLRIKVKRVKSPVS